ncbi:MucR family transcriptional regulator [Rhizobium leguminosarum]|uniref:MucR family transcriptional regulator n=2 Tax=Rhizobium leguminosarum TaxID=384 RepID=A0ACD5FC10_RHILE
MSAQMLTMASIWDQIRPSELAHVLNLVDPRSRAAFMEGLPHDIASEISYILAVATNSEKQKPAVSVRNSVQDEAITCLECGNEFKSLKRHLMTHHSLSPDEYREKWGLPADYPMVAPAYAEERSRIISKIMGVHRPNKRRRG